MCPGNFRHFYFLVPLHIPGDYRPLVSLISQREESQRRLACTSACVARRTLETDSLVPSSKMSYRRPLTISGIYSFQGGNTCQRRLKLVRAGVGLRRRRNAPGAVRKGTPKSKIRMDKWKKSFSSRSGKKDRYFWWMWRVLYSQVDTKK
jgi:hypothetical protein